MKIKFIQQHIVRGQTRAEDLVYEKDRVVDFRGAVEETYARAYIERGYAIEHDQTAERAPKAEPVPPQDRAGSRSGGNNNQSSASGNNGSSGRNAGGSDAGKSGASPT